MTAVLSLLLLAADVALMARIHMTGLPGQSPRRLPELKKAGDH